MCYLFQQSKGDFGDVGDFLDGIVKHLHAQTLSWMDHGSSPKHDKVHLFCCQTCKLECGYHRIYALQMVHD